MEALFVSAYSLPGIVYLSVGAFAFVKMRDRDSGRYLCVLFLVIALSFLSGGPYMLFGGDRMSFDSVLDGVALKVYAASSALPCAFVKREVYRRRSWLSYYIPVVILSVLVLVTDAMMLAGRNAVPYGILLRAIVAVALVVFCFIVYVYLAYGNEKRDGGGVALGKELLIHIFFLSIYNFILLMYSFGIHQMVDYFLLAAGFTAVHLTMFTAFRKSDSLSAFFNLERDVKDDAGEARRPIVNCLDAGDMTVAGGGTAVQSLKERLISYFETEKPYLSKTLSMEEVAMRLFTNKSYLSKTINMEMNKNFRELVNYFRVREAMRIFSGDMGISMSELRDKCGFNNNASFTSAFKLNTGRTPGEWCRDMKNKQEMCNKEFRKS